MRQLRARVGVIITLVILMCGAFSPVALAATPNSNGAFNVVVAPATQDLEVKPGGTVSTTLQVRNQGLSTEHIKVTVMKFGASGQDGTPQLENVGPNDTFVKWATFSTTSFDAEPNVWTPVKMTISPPKTAAFGYYYAVIFSRDQPKAQPATANLLGAVASLILLDVQAPGAVRQASITGFSTTAKVSEFLPVTFTVQMHNTGNVHVAPRGNIFITKGGKSIGLLEVNLAEGNVLPGTFRKFTAQWTNGTPVYKLKVADGKVVLNKQGQDVSTLDWSNFNMSKLRFGKYNAKLVMVYNDGEGDVATQAQLSFWVIPWRIIAAVLVVLVLIVAGSWTIVIRPLRRRFKKGGTVRLR